MENLELAIVHKKSLENIQSEISEIKALIKNKFQTELNNQWLTKSEAKKRLHICLKTLDTYLSRGILPYSKFAGKTYIKAGDIEAHLHRHYMNPKKEHK